MTQNVGVRLHVPKLWAAAIEEWLDYLRAGGRRTDTITTSRQRLERTARHIGIADPWQVTRKELVTYFGQQTDWDTETRRGHRTSLRSFYGWAADEEEIILRSPALGLPKIKPKTPNPMPAPDSVYHPARAAADDREELMLDLAAEHGMRRCEVSVVHTRDDLIEDLVGWTLLVHGKGGKTRLVPLLDETAEKLRRLPAGYAFPGQVSGHISARWCGALINRLLPGAWTIHKLRHRAATEWWKASDHDLLWVARLLGHASTETTLLYVYDDDEQRGREIVDRAASAVQQRRRRGLRAA